MAKSRIVSFLIILAIYALAFFTGFFAVMLFSNFNFHIFISFFLADIIATIVVWIFGMIFNNSSVYDPYWSIAPIAILSSWMVVKQADFSGADILFLIAVIFWGVRLTYNWAIRWQGLSHQDWRYTMLKENSPKMWFFTNLIGINIMPTVIVFLALMPAYYGIGHSYRASGYNYWTLAGLSQINAITIAGFIFCISAILIQTISDRQMDNFRRDNARSNTKNSIENNIDNVMENSADNNIVNNTDNKKGKNTKQSTDGETEPVGRHIDRGLWRYSRHPNYFGEVLFWWGIWIMQVSIFPNVWFTVSGPIIMTLLFIFISIPMMERYVMSSRPSFAEYKKQVSMLIPWFRFKS